MGATPKDRLVHERQAKAHGYAVIAGVDEVGMATWAGPMVAAAVILGDGFDVTGIRDSKKVGKNPARLQAAYARIRQDAVAIGVATATPQEVDTDGFRTCHMRILREAVERLDVEPDYVLVDHYMIPDLRQPQEPIPKGDDASASIAAASIIAKVICDDVMIEAEKKYPGYDFAKTKGYGGPQGSVHRLQLERFGPSPIHRRSVKPVREWLERHAPEAGEGPS